MAKLLACPDSDQLHAIALGVSPGGGADDLLAHLEQCVSCATRMSAIVAEDPLVEAVRAKQNVANSQDQQAVSGLVEKVRALVAGARSTEQTLDSVASAAVSDDTGAFSWSDEPMPDEKEDDGLAPPLAPDELGRLGPYRVLKVLGEGGMGKVFLAEDPHLQRSVALKVMKARLAKNTTARQRFLREARLAAKIEHDHIVHIYQVGEDRGIPFLAMQLLKGTSLEDLLHRCKTLNVKQILRIGIQVAQGLAAAHEHGMIHRDIKPGNIWIEPTGGGRVKILDFGLARTSQGDIGITQSGAILGTPAYMPPEQARGEKVDQRCDLYSLGCVLYRMATGELPLKGNDTMSMLMALAMNEPIAPANLNPEIPQPLSDFIMKLLAKDPDHRVGSAREVVQALKAIERGNNVPAPSDTVALSASMFEPPAELPMAPSNPIGRLQAEPGEEKSERSANEKAATAKQSVPRPRRNKPRLVAALLSLVGLAVLAGGLYGIIHIAAPEGAYVIDTDDPDFAFSVSKGTVVLEDKKAKRTYNLRVLKQKSGEFDLEVTDPGNDLTFNTKTFSIKRGEKVALKAWFERKGAAVAKGGAVDDTWLKTVAALPAKEQVKAVADKLKELNSGFDGKIDGHKIEGGMVTELAFLTDKVTDISPVRALPELRTLHCGGTSRKNVIRGELADLSPLKDMKLTELNCASTKVSNLSPLKGMKLTALDCFGTLVSDLAPLKDMKLSVLDCEGTLVRDLSPLKNMPITNLGCENTSVTDLSPLKGMPLVALNCNFKAERDTAILRSIKTLKSINGKTPAAFWQSVDASSPPAAQPKLLASLKHGGQVFALAFTSDGLLISGGQGANWEDLKVFDPIKGVLLHVLPERGQVRSFAMSRDNKTLYYCGHLKEGDGFAVRALDLPSKKVVRTFPTRLDNVRCLALSADESTLAYQVDHHALVQLIDLKTGKKGASAKVCQYYPHAMKFSPDGSHLVVVNHSRQLVIFEAKAMREVAKKEIGFCDWLDVTGDGLIAVPLGRLFDLKGNLVHQQTKDAIWSTAGVISPDGKRLATGGENGIVYLWGMGGKKELLAQWPAFATRTGKDAPYPLNTLAFSRDGKTLAAAGRDGIINVWDVTSIPAALGTAATCKNSLGIEFARVPKGKAWLGGGGGEVGDQEVEFQRDFYLGVHEVTQGEWESIMGANPSAFSRQGDEADLVKNIPDADLVRFPVDSVTWTDCQVFLKKLNDKAKDTGWLYRLPTSEEWEYACRGGPSTKKVDFGFHYYFDLPGNTLLLDKANIADSKLNRTAKVGSYSANRLGLFDMHGNVWEMCGTADGGKPTSFRGGSFSNDESNSATNWHGLAADFKANDVGFRLARVRVDADAPPKAVYLDDLKEIAYQGHLALGKHGKKFGTQKQPFTFQGETPDHSLVTATRMEKSVAHVIYELAGGFDSFHGIAGIYEGESKDDPLLTFRVMGDGKQLWESKPINKRGQGEEFQVSVRGIKKRRLEVSTAGGGIGHAVWIDPRLVRPRVDPATAPPLDPAWFKQAP